jgi:hypothetical protein
MDLAKKVDMLQSIIKTEEDNKKVNKLLLAYLIKQAQSSNNYKLKNI